MEDANPIPVVVVEDVDVVEDVAVRVVEVVVDLVLIIVLRPVHYLEDIVEAGEFVDQSIELMVPIGLM